MLFANIVQNGMTDDYRSLPDALMLAGTIIGWNWLLPSISFRASPAPVRPSAPDPHRFDAQDEMRNWSMR